MRTPSATVTMMGAQGCGKTTYFLGMYAVLSAGLQGYFLIADPDIDYELSATWDDMFDDGEMPPPNPAEIPKTYPLSFLHDTETVLSFSWQDYRGGAMSDPKDDETVPDAPELHTRLAASDSIYLVISGAHLTEPVDDSSYLATAQKTKARRMNSRLLEAIQRRRARGGQVPSLVVLVTKADLIARANPGLGKEEQLDIICGSVKRLLKGCFVHGTNTLVCPVRIGEFADDHQTKVGPGEVSPRNLQYPMIFSFLHYLDEVVESARIDARALQDRRDEDRKWADKIQRGWTGPFQSGRIGQLRAKAMQADGELTTLTADLARSERQLNDLSEDLRMAIKRCDVAVFEDGDRVQ